jgi:hypothetical protein
MLWMSTLICVRLVPTGRESDVPAGVVSNCRVLVSDEVASSDVRVVFDCWHGELARLLPVSL